MPPGPGTSSDGEDGGSALADDQRSGDEPDSTDGDIEGALSTTEESSVGASDPAAVEKRLDDALARRFQLIVVRLAHGFGAGLSRYVPAAESDAERDLTVTFASVLLLVVATAFGAALYLAAPTITRLTGEGPQFLLYLRIFGIGTPGVVWFTTVSGILRAFEAVGAMNLTTRIAVPVAELGVALAAWVLVGDVLVVAVGVVAVRALLGAAGAAWIARDRGIRPRLRGPDAMAVHRRYLRYTIPIFFTGFAYTTQRLGFYPLIAWFLSGTAGGLFAVGVLVG